MLIRSGWLAELDSGDKKTKVDPICGTAIAFIGSAAVCDAI